MHNKIRLYLPASVYYPLKLMTLGASAFLVSNPYTFVPMFLLSFVPYQGNIDKMIRGAKVNKFSIRIVCSKKHIKMDPYCHHDFMEDEEGNYVLHKSHPLQYHDIVKYLIVNFIRINKNYVRLLILWCLLLIYIEMVSETYDHATIQNYLRKDIVPATYHLIPFELPIKN